jgi:hypothetical protein
MYANKLTATVLLAGAAFAFGTPAMSADLPQSGTIKIHSDIKTNPQVVDVGGKHIMGSANGWGVSYNDAGSGPLHMGAWFCAFSLENVNGAPNYAGSCAFGDAGGADKIYITWTGKGIDNGDEGTGTIIGGIGKYAGIQGKMAWQCHPIDASQNVGACTQQFDYQLKSATN